MLPVAAPDDQINDENLIPSARLQNEAEVSVTYCSSVSDTRAMLRWLAGCPDLMIARRFPKREFLIGELEILVPNRPFRRLHRGLAADAGYWSFANRFGMNAGYRMPVL